jgi:hypothetical protein
VLSGICPNEHPPYDWDHALALLHDAKVDQGRPNVMQMTDIPMAMMWGMGLIWLLVIIFLLLGIAAFIKYLRS